MLEPRIVATSVKRFVDADGLRVAEDDGRDWLVAEENSTLWSGFRSRPDVFQCRHTRHRRRIGSGLSRAKHARVWRRRPDRLGHWLLSRRLLRGFRSRHLCRGSCTYPSLGVGSALRVDGPGVEPGVGWSPSDGSLRRVRGRQPVACPCLRRVGPRYFPLVPTRPSGARKRARAGPATAHARARRTRASQLLECSKHQRSNRGGGGRAAGSGHWGSRFAAVRRVPTSVTSVD